MFRERKRSMEKKLSAEFKGVPVPDVVPVAWKVTFDSLKICVRYPQLSEQTTALLFKSLNEHLTQNTAIMFPDESKYKDIEELHMAFECYKGIFLIKNHNIVYLF